VTDVKVVAAGIISFGLAMAVAGMSAGAASAAPAAPAIAGPQFISQDGPGRGHGHGHDDWWWDGDHGRGDWNPVDACIGVQGPFGYVQGSACI
jgi:hypothetical protein